MTHRFDIDDDEYEVTVKHFDPGSPGKTSGPPEDCYPPEDWEIEFLKIVRDVTNPKPDLFRHISFPLFIRRYATCYTDGDEDKALEAVEHQVYEEIREQAEEHTP